MCLFGQVEGRQQKRNQQRQNQNNKNQQQSQQQNYYQILGVKQQASEKEIRKAYKKLAIKYHPDRINDQEEKEKAQKKFAEINNAYEVLTDPKQKEDYDFQLKHGFSKDQQQQQQQHQNFNMGGSSFFDFFGGGGGFDFGGFNFGQQQQKQQRNQYSKQQKRQNYEQQHQFRQQQREQHEQGSRHLFKESEVKEIDIEKLSEFFRREEVWLILFYLPGSLEEKIALNWREMAGKKREIYSFAAVDCAEEEDICQDEFQVQLGKNQKFKIMGFPVRGGLKSARNFEENQQINQKNIHRFAVSLLNNERVQVLNWENYLNSVGDKRFVVLFTDKDVIPPVFTCIANQLEGKFEFAVVYSEQKELVKKFQIQKYPSLLILEDALNYQGEFYENEFTKEKITHFLKSAKGGASQKSNKFIELTREMLSQSAVCGKNDSKLCLILNLGNNFKILDEMSKIPGKYANDPIRFLYIKQGFNEEFQGEPGLLLVKGKRQKYASAKLNEKSIGDFLDQALDGSSTFQRFNQSLFDNIFK